MYEVTTLQTPPSMFLAGDVSPVGISLTFRRLSSPEGCPSSRGGRSRRDAINSVCQARWEMSICFSEINTANSICVQTFAGALFATKLKTTPMTKTRWKMQRDKRQKINTTPGRWADSREVNMFFLNEPRGSSASSRWKERCEMQYS